MSTTSSAYSQNRAAKARPCSHQPLCPDASDPAHGAAVVMAAHPDQGWSLLCNGVILFTDTGELLPDGSQVAPHRPTDESACAGNGSMVSP